MHDIRARLDIDVVDCCCSIMQTFPLLMNFQSTLARRKEAQKAKSETKRGESSVQVASCLTLSSVCAYTAFCRNQNQ
jgi:hypothetical protein